MHIPDGYISPKVFVPFYLLFIPLVVKGFKKMRHKMDEQVLPLLSSLTALSFIIMMFNVPVPGGTSGHALGAALIAILFGPWAGFLSVSLVLLLQALLFGDGGITTYAINAMAMGYVASFSGYYTWKVLKDKVPDNISYFFSGWVSIVLASAVVAVVLGVEPLIAKNPQGVPVYFPYGFKITFPAVVGSTILVFGIIEGLFTAFGVSYFRRYLSVENVGQHIPEGKRTSDVLLFFFVVVLILLLVPLGLITESPAWGEWELGFFQQHLGFIPQGIQKLSGWYVAPLADYSLPGMGAVASYYLSAILAFFFMTLVFYFFSGKRGPVFDKLFFVQYLLVLMAVVVSTNPVFILAMLLVSMALSGKDILRLLVRSFLALLFFNLFSSFYFLFEKNYNGLLLFNLRSFTLVYLTLLAGKKLNLFAILSFSPQLGYVLSLAYSQITNFVVTYQVMKQAMESRRVSKISFFHSYRIIGVQVNLFVQKAMENSREITEAIKSRSML